MKCLGPPEFNAQLVFYSALIITTELKVKTVEDSGKNCRNPLMSWVVETLEVPYFHHEASHTRDRSFSGKRK